MSVTEATPVRASLAPVELPLLTLQLLTQLQYDRDIVKSYYESCKQDLNLHKQKSAKEIARWQQTTDELQFEVTALNMRAKSAAEASNDLELQLKDTKHQLKIAQERMSELEALAEHKDEMIEKQNENISETISQMWAGIQRVEQSSDASKAVLVHTKENLTQLLNGEDIGRLMIQVQNLMEVMHNNTQLFEARDAAEQRVQNLLDKVRSLEENVEQRSKIIKTFQKFISSITLIQDDMRKQHSQLRTTLTHHKSQIVRIEAELPTVFQNFTSSYQKYKEQLLQERLKKLLNGKYMEEILLEVAKSGKVEDISLLLHFEVDTEARDSSGKTALHLAAENGHLKACEVLLDGGARIEAIATGFEGNTPVYLAAWQGHLDIVRLFAARGAKLSRKNRNGATPLKVARVWNKHDVVKYLEEQGATL